MPAEEEMPAPWNDVLTTVGLITNSAFHARFN